MSGLVNDLGNVEALLGCWVVRLIAPARKTLTTHHLVVLLAHAGIALRLKVTQVGAYRFANLLAVHEVPCLASANAQLVARRMGWALRHTDVLDFLVAFDADTGSQSTVGFGERFITADRVEDALAETGALN